jgi:hypothetical protein
MEHQLEADAAASVRGTTIIFEGAPPFPLSTVQTATAQFAGETVEMTLFLLDDHQQMASLCVPMSIERARRPPND